MNTTTTATVLLSGCCGAPFIVTGDTLANCRECGSEFSPSLDVFRYLEHDERPAWTMDGEAIVLAYTGGE